MEKTKRKKKNHLKRATLMTISKRQRSRTNYASSELIIQMNVFLMIL